MKKFTPIFFTLIFIMNLSELHTQDWPNLNKYKSQNEQLKSSKNTENRVVFMGNSITELWLNIHPEFFNGKNYINRGISGQTTPQMLIRFRQDVIDLSPRIVVILAGINDIAENTGTSSIEMIENNIISMVELAKSNNIRVILCSVLPAEKFPWSTKINPAEIVVNLNQKIKDYANKNNIIYVDYFSKMANKNNGMKEGLANDGIHPNKSGYLIMEPLLQKAINQLINDE